MGKLLIVRALSTACIQFPQEILVILVLFLEGGGCYHAKEEHHHHPVAYSTTLFMYIWHEGDKLDSMD